MINYLKRVEYKRSGGRFDFFVCKLKNETRFTLTDETLKI